MLRTSLRAPEKAFRIIRASSLIGQDALLLANCSGSYHPEVMPADSETSDPVMPSAAGCFGTTHWSLVLAAADNESASSREALEKLCQAYWRPIYTYVRRRGYAASEAEDLTQAFFAHFLGRKLLTVVDRQRGRFRTFVLHACEYFLVKEWSDARRLKRGGGHQILSRSR